MKELAHNIKQLWWWFLMDLSMPVMAYFVIPYVWQNGHYAIAVVIGCFGALGIVLFLLQLVQIWEFTFYERD